MRNLCMVSFLQMCLLEYAVHCSGREIVSQVSGDGNPSGFIRMFVLAMASFCCYKVPSIGFDHLDNFPDFQDGASSTLYWYKVFLHFRFLCDDLYTRYGERHPHSQPASCWRRWWTR